MSVVMTVDHTIKGIAEGRLYEETYETGDGGCGPYFEFGKRYIYNQGLFGVEELPEDATEAQLTHWRSLDAPEPKPYKYPFPEYPYQCLSIDSEVASELAEAATAVVATVLSFRIDDAQLTDDLSACNQPDSAACKQLTDAVISVRIDIEDSIKGPNELGPREVSYWSRGNCQLPQPGQRFLLGGSYGDHWADLNEPRVLLSEPPSDEQIADWRTAALVGDSDTD
jgi:hypothetical protein